MDRGFTLLELMIVLVIVAVVTAAVAPAMGRWMEQDEIELATSDIEGLLRDARMAALEQGTPVSVILDPVAGRYWVTLGRDGEPVRMVSGQLPPSAEAQIRGSGPRVRFWFDPHGPAYGDSVFVRVAGRSAVVGVDPWTGDLHVRP